MWANLADARFESLSEFLAIASGPTRRSDNRAAYDTCLEQESGFYGPGCNSGADADRIVRDGWQEGRDKVSAMLADLAETPPFPRDRRRRLSRADFGDSVDMGAVYSGQLDRAWTVAKRRDVLAPRPVTIVINAGLAGYADYSVLIWRGVAALALADKLSAAGYMVRIVIGDGGATSAVFGDRRPVSIRIVVKDYNAPATVSVLAACLHPCFKRSIILRMIARHADHKIYTSIKNSSDCKLEPGDIYCFLGGPGGDNVSRETAIAWVNEQVRKLNDESMAA